MHNLIQKRCYGILIGRVSPVFNGKEKNKVVCAFDINQRLLRADYKFGEQMMSTNWVYWTINIYFSALTGFGILFYE